VPAEGGPRRTQSQAPGPSPFKVPIIVSAPLNVVPWCLQKCRCRKRNIKFLSPIAHWRPWRRFTPSYSEIITGAMVVRRSPLSKSLPHARPDHQRPHRNLQGAGGSPRTGSATSTGLIPACRSATARRLTAAPELGSCACATPAATGSRTCAVVTTVSSLPTTSLRPMASGCSTPGKRLTQADKASEEAGIS